MLRMECYQIIFFNLAALIVFMAAVWFLSLLKKDASIADIFWGPGFVLVAWITFFLSDVDGPRHFIVVAMTTVWGLRLSIHLFFRNWGSKEDPRYQNMRSAYGKHFWIVSLFTVFLLQGFILWVISLVVQLALFVQSPVHLTWLDGLGIVIWSAGFVLETIADRQLYRFKSDPANKGRVMDLGLWAYSRHPNYFGEMLIWWGFYAIAINDAANAWVILSPMLITFLLLKVSGVALLEKNITERRPAYADYIRRTSAFFPWFPKKEGS
jgi:steroid 5-alpha reductase family enzyme